MTRLLFREDAYLREAEATIIGHTERGGILLDQTIFYATAGGQPGDAGLFETAAGPLTIATTVYDEAKRPVHVPAEGQTLPQIGNRVKMRLDWASRHRNMRAHTLMHLLCCSVPFPVTGSAISADGGRIDFDIPEGQIPGKTELGARINALITANHPVSFAAMTEEELDARPELVRTMFVKPPRGAGLIRLVMIGEGGRVDLQPCGGTHVNATGEIGPIAVSKIENKGKINRRIRVTFA
ncbi:MAG: alanyl-tRNA editing protein [Alphaproteobacteria bacterium]|nr:alanyl-tRNA editing protein [Alphaproteobacteria bacterium]